MLFKGHSGQLLETPFSEPFLRTVLRTPFYCNFMTSCERRSPNHFLKVRCSQPYWGGETSGNALEASKCLEFNHRAWGLPAVPSRGIPGKALRAFPGNFSRVSYGKSQPYWLDLCRTKLPRTVFNSKTKGETNISKSAPKRPLKILSAVQPPKGFADTSFTVLHPQFQTQFQTFLHNENLQAWPRSHWGYGLIILLVGMGDRLLLPTGDAALQ